MSDSMRRRRLALAAWILPFCLVPGCAWNSSDLAVVDGLDLDRYVGVWYEVARYPAPFQQGCFATTAEYTRLDDGTIEVVNRCRDGAFDGRERSVRGKARVPDATEPAKLKVSFFGPFEADYWVIDVDEDYRYAIVSEPRRRFLWILSRTPTLDESTMEMLLADLAQRGFDPARIERTPQPAAE